MREEENPLFVSRGALFLDREPGSLSLQWDSVTAPEVRRERVPRHANGRGNKARGVILVISYLNLNAGRTEETSQCRTALWSLLPACLPALLSSSQKPAIIHCPVCRTVVASRVYWWFPSGVMGLASARHRSVDSRRPRSGRFLMDIVGCLPLRWCIIVDDLAEAKASTRYLAPPHVLITARYYWDFKESVISERVMLPFRNGALSLPRAIRKSQSEREYNRGDLVQKSRTKISIFVLRFSNVLTFLYFE